MERLVDEHGGAMSANCTAGPWFTSEEKALALASMMRGLGFGFKIWP